MDNENEFDDMVLVADPPQQKQKLVRPEFDGVENSETPSPPVSPPPSPGRYRKIQSRVFGRGTLSSYSSRRQTIRDTQRDVETHTTGIIRESQVEEILENKQAGESHQRSKNRWKKAARLVRVATILESSAAEQDEADEEAQQEEEPEPVDRQYRLTATRKYLRRRDMLTGILMPPSSTQEMEQGNRWNLNNMLTAYLHWTFRTSFVMLLLVSMGFFWFFTLVFAALFTLFGQFQPECIFIGETEDGEVRQFGRDSFKDAFALSWTTFSTVGYGHVYPQISTVETGCVLMNMFASFEAYVGVIFVGFVGAIIFGKVARVQSRAKIQFSDPIVIRYGSGVLVGNDDDQSDTSSLHLDQIEKSQVSNANEVDGGANGFPCPVLEFRVINRQHDFPGGEIMNANINCSAVLEASEVSPTIRLATSRTRSNRRLKSLIDPDRSLINRLRNKGNDGNDNAKGAFSFSTAGRIVGKVRDLATSPLSLTPLSLTPRGQATSPATVDEEMPLEVATFDLPNQRVTVLEKTAVHTVYDEDPTGEVVPRRIFSKISIETPNHPFFKRVWTIRHVLDQHSPLLKADAKGLVEANGGFWPPELNSYDKVRESIYFQHILVSFSGTANTTANTVYAQKMYDFVDVNIGYSFCNLLHMTQGRLEVDDNLINDVMEQNGGGGEPFRNVQGGFEIPGQQVKEAVVDATKEAVNVTGDAVADAVEKIQEVIGNKEE